MYIWYVSLPNLWHIHTHDWIPSFVFASKTRETSCFTGQRFIHGLMLYSKTIELGTTVSVPLPRLGGLYVFGTTFC